MPNCGDPDQMPHSAASDLGLHCLQRPIPILKVIMEVKWTLIFKFWRRLEEITLSEY